ncbi:hypothetical protein CA54_50750 [Symmachiella macrocystis]|uniref:ATP-grasp domain-containing protein n=2 Tax=Symmachiella macrocystis TaxID=2527985 RepID=A0A5C6B5Z2_9PLAN|nr:hypothetical protein CA54_50750 [Symmachiella macrocystis]
MVNNCQHWCLPIGPYLATYQTTVDDGLLPQENLLMRILITAARAPVVLDMMRHLTRHGHEVLLTDSRAFPLSRFSRLKCKYFRTSSPGSDPARYRQEIRELAERESVDVVLPMFEEVMHLAAGIDEFDGTTRVFCDDFEKIREIHNKYTFIDIARNAGMSVPDTYLLDGPDALQDFADCATQFVFKPVYSRFGDQVLLGPDAKRFAEVTPSAQCPWVAQEFLDGDLYCSFGIAHQGHLRLHSAYQPTCFAGRAGILFNSAQEEDILRQVQQLVKHIDFTGFISFDFIRDRQGRFHVIECNPRSTSGVHFLNATDEASGMDSGTSLSRAVLEPDGPLIEASANQTRMLGFAMAIYGWNKKNHAYGSLPVWHGLTAASDVVFSWKDPLPGVAAPIMLAETMISAVTNGVKLTRSGTYDHEWNDFRTETLASV